MTFDEWWEKPTDGWYLGRMASDDEKRYAQVAWEAATLAEREEIIAAVPGGCSVDPQWICDMIRERSNVKSAP